MLSFSKVDVHNTEVNVINNKLFVITFNRLFDIINTFANIGNGFHKLEIS